MATTAPSPFTDPRTGISPQFRSSAMRVFWAIVAFILFYILLLAFAVGLLIASGYIAFLLLGLGLRFVSLAAAAGVVVLGITFFLFLIKFIFARSKVEEPIAIRITEKDQPELMKMIHDVADAAQAPRPKKVILVDDVNASVSYDSTFWSLFLPVRKNLRIGLGLMNVLTVSELRAVLAHEFGHFSQRSMKLGSYVYTVNKVIHDLVAHRDRWDNWLEEWAGSGGIFGWFAVITAHLVGAVRKLLVEVYQWINRKHSGLSLQMEYHADALAASLTSSRSLIDALHKTQYGSMAFQATVGALNQRLPKAQMADDVYGFQRARIALWRQRPFPSDVHQLLGDVRKERVAFTPRLVIKDQWASHPSLDEREKHVEGLEGNVAADDRESWVLLRDAPAIKARMTEFLYKSAQLPKEHTKVDAHRFFTETEVEEKRYALDPFYHGFYGDREVGLRITGTEALTTAELYNAEVRQRIEQLGRTRQDHATLLAMKNGEINVDNYELDGRKLTKKDTANALELVAGELNAEERWLREMDAKSVALNKRAAEAIGRTEEWMAAMKAVTDLQDIRGLLDAAMDQAKHTHARLISKPRFEVTEWRSIGHDADTMYTRFKHALRQHPPATLLEADDHKDEIKALERFALSAANPTEFEAEYFLKMAQLLQATLNETGRRELLALKALTDLQVEIIGR
jgi:Zn-dependent protease with chaperone function